MAISLLYAFGGAAISLSLSFGGFALSNNVAVGGSMPQGRNWRLVALQKAGFAFLTRAVWENICLISTNTQGKSLFVPFKWLNLILVIFF
ncbi:MAG: hypothetical protein U9N62_03725 [Thermotogota bacterium]|nr:hypothetical protein [Thermotogota bacterium]